MSACHDYPLDYDLPPCTHCGFVRRRVPAWAKVGAVFALGGCAFRIVVANGSTNRGTNMNEHFRDYVIAEQASDEAWALPELPATKSEVYTSLKALQALPHFSPEELARAIHLVSAE